MAAIYHNGDWYGLGSDVVANPQDSATDTLTKVGIDGTVYSVEDADAVHTSDIGTANGVAELDANGLVPSSQLPSYVDDVLEYASVSAFPATGETGKIYVALDTNLTYRWSGSAYVEISPSLALGETSSTAYRGDRGKTAYDHATESGKISAAVSSGFYKFGATAQGHIASTTAVAKSDLTALGVADQNDVDAIEEDIEGFKTVTGKYITITDGAELPAKNYSITLSPVQEGSGDPSPTNVRPIHGADEVGVRVCGVNLWDETYTDIATSVKYKALKVGDGQFTLSSTTPQASGAAQLFLLAGDVSSGASTSDNGVWNGHSKTVTASGGYVTIGYREQYGVSPTDYKTQLEKGATATDYEPYTATDTTITLPSTVYGGSVEQGGSGEKTYVMVEYDGSNDENWERFSSGSAGAYAMQIALSARMNYTSVSALPPILANYLRPISQAATWGNYDSFVSANTVSEYIYTGIKGITTVEDWRAYLAQNPLQICFELATPTDITVTPFPQTLLEGVNNLWAEMKENSVVIDNAQQSLSYQPQNIVGQLRQEIEAKPDSFAQLSDTSFSNLANGQIPKWNSTTNKWENANESGGGGASSLAELSDTNISSPADGQILKWDGTSSKWVNAAEYSYSLPTASASTKGGIKVGDNLAMNGEVLSAKTVPWTKVWNKNSGETFTFPSDKTEILLVIRSVALLVSTLASAVYTVGSGQTSYMVAADGVLNGTITLYFTVGTNGNTSIINNTSSSTSAFDFEVWAR